MIKFSQNFVALSEYMNFTRKCLFYIDETFDFQLWLAIMKGLTKKNGLFYVTLYQILLYATNNKFPFSNYQDSIYTNFLSFDSFDMPKKFEKFGIDNYTIQPFNLESSTVNIYPYADFLYFENGPKIWNN